MLFDMTFGRGGLVQCWLFLQQGKAFHGDHARLVRISSGLEYGFVFVYRTTVKELIFNLQYKDATRNSFFESLNSTYKKMR